MELLEIVYKIGLVQTLQQIIVTHKNFAPKPARFAKPAGFDSAQNFSGGV